MPDPIEPTGDARKDTEEVDEAKTADVAPAPVHTPEERKVLVRDAYGRDPYGGDRFGPDGEPDAVELGQEPYSVPDPTEPALQRAKARSDKA